MSTSIRIALATLLLATTGCLGIFQRDRASHVEVEAIIADEPPPSPRPPAPKQPKRVSAEEVAALRREYALGVHAYEANRPAEAVQRLCTVYKVLPDLEGVQSYLKRAYIAVGMEHYMDGRLSDSIEVWKQILQVDPRDAQALSYIRKTTDELARLPQR